MAEAVAREIGREPRRHPDRPQPPHARGDQIYEVGSDGFLRCQPVTIRRSLARVRAT